MKKLKKLQREFFQAFVSLDQNANFISRIRTSKNLTPEQRFNIYRNSIRENITGALKSIFSVCCKLVGEEFFHAMIIQFILVESSKSPNLNDYGRVLPEFIENFKPAKELVYLSDMARLEWAWHEVCRAKNTKGFDFIALKNIPEEKQASVVLKLPDASRLLTSPYPIHRIWEINQDDDSGDQNIELSAAVKLIIWRMQDATMRIDVLQEQQWKILQAIHRGNTLGEICEQFSQHKPPIDVGSLLSDIVQHGWLETFTIIDY